MSRKWKRLLSFLLAIALVVTTFGSDFASANVYATEGEEVEAVETAEAGAEAEPETLPEIFEEVPEEPASEVTTDAYADGAAAVASALEGSTETPVATDEAVANAGEGASDDAAATEGSSVENAATESTEDAAAEASSEDNEDAAAEASSEEDAAAEASSEEEETEANEKKFWGDATIDGIKIELYAEAGVLPADAQLQAEKVSAAKETEITDVFDEKFNEAEDVETISFDIKIWSPSLNDYVQPEDGTVEVKFSEISQASNENSELAVYHVSDDLGTVEQMAEASEKTDTNISFEAEHFSIYTIVITYYALVIEVGEYSFNAELVDESGKSLPGSVTVRSADFSFVEILDAASIAPNVAGYKFVKATYKNKEFTHLVDILYKLHAFNGFDDLGVIDSDKQVRFVYKFVGYETNTHIDLGFDKKDYDDYYDNATVTASVSSINNGNEVTMSPIDYDSEIGTYEYRLDLNGQTVKYTDTVVFRVYYGDQTYKMECSSEDNMKANERCYESHKNIQNQYGFDYIASFTKDFDLEDAVVYHANLPVEVQGLTEIGENVIFDNDETVKKYAVKTYDAVMTSDNKKLVKSPDYTFLGWATDAKATEPEYKNGDKVNVLKDSHVDLYAVWQEFDLNVTTDHIDIGFKKTDFDMYKNGGAKISVYVNGTEYDMWAKDLDAQIGTYEYRLYLATYEKSYPKQYSGLKSVSVDDNIVFKVEYAEQEYLYECSTEDNVKAANRCYEAHKKIQNIFGFDYILDIREEFNLKGDVIYHANFDVPKDQLDKISETIHFKFGENQKEYTIKANYEDVKTDSVPAQKLAARDGYIFLGWSKNPQAETPEYLKGAVNKTTVEKKKTVDLYAIWRADLEPAYYKVEYYYQNNQGAYPSVPNSSSTLREVSVPPAGLEVEATRADKTPKSNIYTLDTDASKLNGTVLRSNTQNDPFILTVYFSRNISGVAMTITAPSDTKVYDASALTTEGTAPTFTVKTGDIDLSDNYSVEVTYDGTITDVGNCDNNIDSYTVTNTVTGEKYYYNVEGKEDSVDKTGKVLDTDAELTQINLVAGTLIVTPLEVKITIPGAAKVYDGSYFDAKNYTKVFQVNYTGDEKEKDKEEKSVKLTNAFVSIPTNVITVADSVKANDEIGIASGYKLVVKGTEFESKDLIDNNNIKLTVINGDLKINKRTVVVKSDDKEGVINGKPFSAPNAKVIFETDPKFPETAEEANDFVKGEEPKYDDFTVIYKGEADNEFTLSFSDEKEENDAIANNYNIIKVYGLLKLTPPEKKWKIVVTLHADGEGSGNEKIVRYNGIEQSADLTVKLHIQSEKEEHEEEVTDENEPLSFLGNIISSLGSFFTIKAFAYDPVEEQKIEHEGTTYYVRGLYIDGGKGTEAKNDDGKDYKRYPVILDYTDMKVFVKDEKGNDVDVTDDLIDKEPQINTSTLGAGENDAQPTRKTEEIGGLTIYKREVTLTSPGAHKTYDGNALTNHKKPAETWPSKYDDVPSIPKQTYGFVDGHKVIMTYKADSRLVGNPNTKSTKLNVFDYEFEDRTVEDNYIVTPDYGLLIVDPIPQDNPPDNPPDITPPSNPGQVLGERRAAEGAVLGARRGATEDPTNNAARIIVIVIAAGIAITILFFGKKREDGGEQ